MLVAGGSSVSVPPAALLRVLVRPMEKALLPPLCCLFRRVFLVKSRLKSAELLLLLEPWYLSERMDSVMPP